MADAASIAKRISDNTIGYLNKGSKWMLNLLDPQNKNLFEMFLWPANLSLSSNIKMIAHAALDSVMARIYIQSADIPFLSFEYENYNEVNEIKDLIYPKEITIVFVENELGFVRNYINYWIQEIIQPDLLAETFGQENSYYFKEGQKDTKKNGIIVPLMGIGLPTPGIISLKGLKPKEQDNITFAHHDGDPMLLTYRFSIDNVWWKTLSGLLL